MLAARAAPWGTRGTHSRTWQSVQDSRKAAQDWMYAWPAVSCIVLANPVLPRSGSREVEVRFSPQKPPRSCQTREAPCWQTKSFLPSPGASAFSPAPAPEDLHTPTHSLTGDTWAERLPISPRQGHLVTNEFAGAVAFGKCLPRDLTVVSLTEETQPLGMS